MTKPQGLRPFLSNDSEVLWLGLMSRDAGIQPSKRIGVRDEVLALDFDRAVSLRLLRFDNEKADENAKKIAYQVSKIFGSGETSDDEILDSSELHELLRDDPYADGTTVIS